jgi:hypothetical protein
MSLLEHKPHTSIEDRPVYDYLRYIHDTLNDIERTLLRTKKIQATDSNGLYLVDDDDNGLFIKDGGNIGFNETTLKNGGSTYKAIEGYASTLAFGASTAGLGFASNAYHDGAWKRKIADEAAMVYLSTSGNISFRVAGSDSADSTISWTQALKIDNDGTATFAGDVNVLDARYIKGRSGYRLDRQYIYVDAGSGNNADDGTESDPIETIDVALERTQSGSYTRIYLEAGETYTLSNYAYVYANVSFLKHGTGDDPIIDLNGYSFIVEPSQSLTISECTIDNNLDGAGNVNGMIQLYGPSSGVALYSCAINGDGTNEILRTYTSLASVIFYDTVVTGDSGSSVAACSFYRGGMLIYNSSGGSWSNYTEPTKGTIITS